MSESPGVINATPAKQPQGKKQRTPSAAQGQGKRNNNNSKQPRRQNPTTSVTQLDGTVSDTVTNASPRSRNPPGQRHSTAASAYPQHNGQMGHLNGQKVRPASMGGAMLPGTPAKEQAYAGPTFQASPAASALPVPKFLGSRSVPNAAHATSLQARMEGEKTPDKIESSPEPDVVSPVPPPRDHQSPLDIFFMADKAEKEKRKSGSIGLSPQLAARLAPPATEPRNPFAGSGRSLFLQELDGDEESLPSPRTVPYNQRPRPVERATSSPGTGGVPYYQGNGQGQGQQHEASTQALKELLFSNVNASPAPKQNGTPPQNPQRNSHNPQTPSPFHNQPSGLPTPGQTSDQQQNGNFNYHYGNRNLSPMFKAVQQRTETPTRPSNLRQEVESPPQAHPYPAQNADANSFSRSFLDQHLRSSVTGNAPPGIISNGATGFPQHPARNGSGGGASASPRTNGTTTNGGTGAKDLKCMEDDLRNLLNIRATN